MAEAATAAEAEMDGGHFMKPVMSHRLERAGAGISRLKIESGAISG
jgi:hypothetical protein